MAAPGSSSLLALLRDKEFISRDQWQELSRISPPLDNAALLRDLVRRTWLTPFQANRIAGGNAKDLILGPYRVFEPIGEGGMGQVFKARHVQMDRMVGLKVIPKEYLANANAVSRFYREVRAVAKLSHPNVVTAHDAGQEGDTHYFAMEFVEGIDLARLVKQSGPLPIAQACDFIRQAALGLQHANEKGLVHRDIKPGNIIVSGGNGTPVAKVLDFGLARFDDQSGQTKLTKLGSVLGTVDYISPEQAGDAREVDTRSDIFSLGCALFYVLTGKPPFAGATAMDRMVARCVREADSVQAARAEVPAALERVLAKMLARNRADRYPSPAEVAAALEPFTRIDASGSLKLQSEPRPPSMSTAPRRAATAIKQAPTASSSAVLPPVMKTPPQQHSEIVPSFAFETMAETGVIAGQRRKATRGGQGSWLHRTPIMIGLVGLALGAMAIWAGIAFLRRTGESAHEHQAVAGMGRPPVAAPAQEDKELPPRPAPVISSPAKEITNPIGMKLVYIPPGTFMMGSPKDEKERAEGEEDQHEVRITGGFYMGACEVTQEEWAKVLKNNPSAFSPNGIGKNSVADRDTRRFPVERVSWNDAMLFCKELSRKEGRDYDLPTEAEWEYACRAGTDTVFHYGDALSSDLANFRGDFPYGGAAKGPNLQRTKEVGSYRANAFGLYDMHGNVGEWCKDRYGRDYYQNSPMTDPQGPGGGKLRVLRGGSWNRHARYCRSADRDGGLPADGGGDIGFRVVLRVPSTDSVSKSPHTLALEPKINKAIDRGVRYLRAQVKDGVVDYSGMPVYTAGMTALAGWTLLECGVAADDAAVKSLADTTRAAAVTSRDTYHLALAIILLDRLGYPADEPLIEGMAVRLLAGQEPTGSWSYKTRLPEETERGLRSYMANGLKNWSKDKKKAEKPRTAADLPVELKEILHNARRLDGLVGGDNSNTQFAMMALWVARRHGLPVDGALSGLSESFRKRQFPSGMWGYIHAPIRPGEPPAGDDQGPRVTMTCAGLLSIALGHGVKRKNKIAVPALDQDACVQAGLRGLAVYLEDPHSQRSQALLQKPGNLHYFLLSMERMAVVYDIKKIGDIDWYVWGAQKLVDTQTLAGNWEGMYRAADTCFALLFLKRANVARDLTLK